MAIQVKNIISYRYKIIYLAAVRSIILYLIFYFFHPQHPAEAVITYKEKHFVAFLIFVILIHNYYLCAKIKQEKCMIQSEYPSVLLIYTGVTSA